MIAFVLKIMVISPSMYKEFWISKLVTIASNGRSRSWNIQFHCAPEDWEVERVYVVLRAYLFQNAKGWGGW